MGLVNKLIPNIEMSPFVTILPTYVLDPGTSEWTLPRQFHRVS